jgi:hypothetical protein
MSTDRSFIELNRASTDRIRALAMHLSDAELQTRVGEHWTVAIVFAHLAFLDRRALYILDATELAGKVINPDWDIFVNDLALPLWAAIPPREAARICLETAETLDKRLENYPPDLLELIRAERKRYLFRAYHRNEHLEEAEAALQKSR